MTAERIDGKAISTKVRDEVAIRVARLKHERGVVPGLAVVLVGDDPGSQIYVRNKRRACGKAGIESFEYRLDPSTAQAEVLALVERLNADERVHGILVQLPLPDQIDEDQVLMAVDPDKDVDGFHPVNMGRLVTGRPGPRSCTPAGIIRMLREIDYSLEGKRALVIGRSTIVGKPMALMLLEQHATVTIAHSRTEDLPAVCRDADVVVAAVGRPKMVQGDWIKQGAVVFDVGIHRTDDGLVGDVDYDAVAKRAGAITPVPGGVGPMTIAMLLSNTVDAAEAST